MIRISPQLRMFLLGLAVSGLILVSFFGGALADRVFVIRPLDALVQRTSMALPATSNTGLGGILTPSGSVADVAEQASGSVVTVAVKTQRPVLDNSIFGLFGVPSTGQTELVQQDIGTGFVVDGQGLIVTNRHVVSNLQAEYLIIDRQDREYTVANIYRDPTNDIAILQVTGLSVDPLPLGDSDRIRVGQDVIAIGTALGEFRHTVTTGVVSGLGRGVTAGDPFGRAIESLENVIQTDAAINPGNSGGPLLDSTGSVIGVNVAVTAGAQNIGFAIPINIIKASIDNFNQTGQFNRPLLGIQYQTISEQAAIANEVPQGALVLEVMSGTAAAEAGLQPRDIITEFDGQDLREEELSALINRKRVGDRVQISYWRDGQQATVQIILRSRQAE